MSRLAQRGHASARRARHEADARRRRALASRRAGRRDAVAAQLVAPFGADPVAGPGRRALHADPRRAEAGAVERGDDALLDHLGRRAAGIGRRDDDDERVAVLAARRGRCRDRRPRRPAPRDRAPSRARPRRARGASCRRARGGGAGRVVPNAASIVTTRRPERCAAGAASRPARSRGARCGARPCRCCETPARPAATGRRREDGAELGAPVVAQIGPARAEAAPRRPASSTASPSKISAM